MDFLLNIDQYLPKSKLVLLLWLFVIIAVFIDLLTGLYKAKSLRYLITSDGLKRSVPKLLLYLTLMGFGAMIDTAIYGLEMISIPYCSVLFCLFVLIIEVKSVFERADEKERKRLVGGAKDVTAILTSKEDFIKAISEYMDKKEKEDKNGKDDSK